MDYSTTAKNSFLFPLLKRKARYFMLARNKNYTRTTPPKNTKFDGLLFLFLISKRKKGYSGVAIYKKILSS